MVHNGIVSTINAGLIVHPDTTISSHKQQLIVQHPSQHGVQQIVSLMDLITALFNIED